MVNFRSIFEYSICVLVIFYAHAIYFMNSYNEFDNFDIIDKFIKRDTTLWDCGQNMVCGFIHDYMLRKKRLFI